MAIDWSNYWHFSEVDFPSSRGEPSETLLEMLDEAREIAGVPFIITSGVRPPDGPDDTSSHITGLAADISAANSRYRFKILESLYAVGFRRIGIYNLHLHADIDESKDQDVCWIGKSK